jgi:hypothetical protein
VAIAEARRLAVRARYVGVALGLLTYYWALVRISPERVLRDARRATPPRHVPSVAHLDASTNSIISAVNRASAIHPARPQCLERALTTRRLLANAGTSSRVVVGVARSQTACVAHAWIEVHGQHNDAARDSFARLVEL